MSDGFGQLAESSCEAHLAKTSREGLDSLTSFQGSLEMRIPVGSVRISPSTVSHPWALQRGSPQLTRSATPSDGRASTLSFYSTPILVRGREKQTPDPTPSNKN